MSKVKATKKLNRLSRVSGFKRNSNKPD